MKDEEKQKEVLPTSTLSFKRSKPSLLMPSETSKEKFIRNMREKTSKSDLIKSLTPRSLKKIKNEKF